MRVFISYRHNDSFGYVQELSRILKESQVGHEACEIFVDVDKGLPGRDFVRVMTRTLEQSDVVLVVVGQHWIAGGPTDGSPDFVWMELRAAIATKVPMIVVLLEDGSPPTAAALPPDLAPVAALKAMSLRDASFDADAARLIAAIGRLDRRPGHEPPPARLRLVEDRSGWLTSEHRLNVHIDGKKSGVLVTGAGATELPMVAGKHAVKLQRGIFSSEVVTVTMQPGQSTTLMYRVSTIGSVSLRSA
jgi:hypothetical protein